MAAIERAARRLWAVTSKPAGTVAWSASPITAAATGTARSARAARAQWLADRQAELLPVRYFHVVFTVPAAVADIAFQNKARVYAILFRAAAETILTIAADPRHLGAEIGHHRRAAHLGSEPAAEPSLMIPGIINSCIFSEHGKLVFRAVPLQS